VCHRDAPEYLSPSAAAEIASFVREERSKAGSNRVPFLLYSYKDR